MFVIETWWYADVTVFLTKSIIIWLLPQGIIEDNSLNVDCW